LGTVATPKLVEVARVLLELGTEANGQKQPLAPPQGVLRGLILRLCGCYSSAVRMKVRSTGTVFLPDGMTALAAGEKPRFP